MATRKPERCRWISGREAFTNFANHTGLTQSAGHIKPLHWYVACRLVIEGGFLPEDVTPQPPFVATSMRGGRVHSLVFDPERGGSGEQPILGGLKTKNVDVVVTRKGVGPVLAISCKGVTKAFRNLTNRMEETIGECTNLHITYPALVLGYYALIRANRTPKDAREAPDIPDGDEGAMAAGEDGDEVHVTETTSGPALKANDIAFQDDGRPAEGIARFHTALSEMTGRRGIRDEISRYEAISLAMVEPGIARGGEVAADYPPRDSALGMSSFFHTLYRRYEERFVFGAPLLAERRMTSRVAWDPLSGIFADPRPAGSNWPELDYEPRLGEPQVARARRSSPGET